MKSKNVLYAITLAGLLFSVMILSSCEEKQSRKYQKEGLDKVIQKHSDKMDYTILLNDMNYEGDKYLHKYQVIYPTGDSTFENEITEWYPVSERFFNTHIDNMGMELASKTNGKLTKTVSPAGYSQYVGNEKYGRWNNRDGGSFWEFYGKYAMISSMFHMFSSPRYSYYDDYRRNYGPYGRTYYGPNNTYGTKSYAKSKSGSRTTWGQKPSSFKDKVRSRVSRSSSNKSSSFSSRNSKTNRNSNRYSKSNTRSRGGGIGK